MKTHLESHLFSGDLCAYCGMLVEEAAKTACPVSREVQTDPTKVQFLGVTTNIRQHYS